MAADTPTADGLRAALALVDAYRFEGEYVPEAVIDFRAVFAVARASLAYDMADLEADEVPIDVSAAQCARLLEPIEWRRNAALAAYNAARADLVRLATGAQGGEA